MRRWIALLSLGAIAACASLPNGGDGVVALEVTQPDSTFLSIGASDTLHAQALDLQGHVVTAAAIVWHTPDTALVALDSVRGIVVGRATSGVARIQAQTGTLLSNAISFSLRDSTTSGALHRP